MIKKYHMGVFPRTLFVAIDETDEDINKFLNGNAGDGVPPMDDNANAYVLSVTDGKDGGALIRFKTKNEVTPAISAHESTHVVFMFCDYLDIKVDAENNEHFAYMMEWCMTKCLETLEAYKISGK